MDANRYHRQTLLPQIGPEGQAALGRARVLLVGCGALGTHLAEQLVRAGVGHLRLVDRDIVEWSNLQRQVLFDENDAHRAWPKAAAAAERLGRINSSIRIEPHVTDVHSGNVESLAGFKPGDQPVDLILDGTDNVATRYLLNDVAVKHRIPWVYGACVGVEGRMMAIRPGESPCLRCVFPNPPSPEELATCDTAGVLAAAASVVASLQAVAAMKLLLRQGGSEQLIAFNLWEGRFRSVSLEDARRPDCPCCGKQNFEFLSQPPCNGAATLCGREAVQVRGERAIELKSLAIGWRRVGSVEENRFFVRCRLTEPSGTVLTAFGDGRLIVQGTRDLGRAKALYARFVGA
jgi:molybdopterin-synthase adenylyltransferase